MDVSIYSERVTYLDVISTSNSFCKYKFLTYTILIYTDLQNTQTSKYCHTPHFGDDDVASELIGWKFYPRLVTIITIQKPSQCVILHAKVNQQIIVHIQLQTQIENLSWGVLEVTVHYLQNLNTGFILPLYSHNNKSYGTVTKVKLTIDTNE